MPQGLSSTGSTSKSRRSPLQSLNGKSQAPRKILESKDSTAEEDQEKAAEEDEGEDEILEAEMESKEGFQRKTNAGIAAVLISRAEAKRASEDREDEEGETVAAVVEALNSVPAAKERWFLAQTETRILWLVSNRMPAIYNLKFVAGIVSWIDR